MKRNERTNYNHISRDIRKNGIESIINIEVPTNYTHEARQAFHELLTAYNLRAVCIYWNDIEKTWALHYEPASYPEAHDEKRRQETEDVDTVTARMTRRNWTWTGYPAPATETEAETAQKAPQEAPAAEAEQQPTETENAPQAATQAADNDSTTDNTSAIIEAIENAHKSRYSARQTAPLTFAIWDNVKNIPIIETTSNGITAYMDIFGIDHIDTDTDEKKEAETMTTTEREALERINARQNAANLFTNITPADIAAELAAMEAEQAAPAPDPDAVTLAPADAACVWDEDGNTITPEETTTNERKEEDNTMSSAERYDYIEHMTEDVKDAIRERYTPDEIREHLDDDRDDFAQELNDDLWTDDSVTGNASGSYYCSSWRAEEAIAHNWDLIADMIDEFDAADILRKGPEAIDVSIRCYLLGQAIDAALDQLDEEITEDDEDAADNIPA